MKLELKEGMRVKCMRNDKPNYWWEFKVGNVYAISSNMLVESAPNRPNEPYYFNQSVRDIIGFFNACEIHGVFVAPYFDSENEVFE